MSVALPAAALESVNYFDLPSPNKNSDLTYPDQPTAFIRAGGTSRMFKPDGAGPFPALVLLPVCSGHFFLNTFDWAKRALDHGYAVLVVDPLGPRAVHRDNCVPPQAVGTHRLMKDGFDAAEHLRKQPFVNPDRIGLMGFSLGAMAGLGAAGAKHAHEDGRRPFQAIVAAYPVCIFKSIKLSSTGQLADVHYVPDQIEVPLLVEMGDRDNEADPKNCIPQLDALKARGAPVDYRLYHATHNWDATETKSKPFRKTGLEGQTIVYEYDAGVTEQSAKDAFAFLDAHLK
jgi:dienelactone hydrolase